MGRYDLHHAIVSQGGYLEVGSLLRRRPPPYTREVMVSTVEELLEELRGFMEQLEAEEAEEKGEGEAGEEGGVEEEEVSGEEEEREEEEEEGEGGVREGGEAAGDEGEEGEEDEGEELLRLLLSRRRSGRAASGSGTRAGGSGGGDGGGGIGKAGERRRLPTDAQLRAAGRTDLLSVSDAPWIQGLGKGTDEALRGMARHGSFFCCWSLSLRS